MPALGCAMPIHYVHCACGADLALKTYWKNPRCKPCRKRAYKKFEAAELFRRRVEARRFRIVCHVLGWEPEQFAEMKRSPMMFRDTPETPAARYDVRLEKRSRRKYSCVLTTPVSFENRIADERA